MPHEDDEQASATPPAEPPAAPADPSAPPAPNTEAQTDKPRRRRRRRRRKPRPEGAVAAPQAAASDGGKPPSAAAAVPGDATPTEAAPRGPAPNRMPRQRGPRRPRERRPNEQRPQGERPGEGRAREARPPAGAPPLREARPPGRGPRGKDGRERAPRGPKTQPYGKSRNAFERKPEPKLYAVEAVVDRGFEDVADEANEGAVRRVTWTIVKRTVADQRSTRLISAVYVLRRDGVDTEFANLATARAAVNKTIAHPEKLTLPKAAYAAAKKK
jgi:hypothetical protein